MDSVVGVIVLVLLAVDGVISAVLGGLFVQVRIGPVPFPVSALISGLVNALLVWAGLHWTSSLGVAATALWTFLLTLAAMTLSGPGGDVVFGGPGFDQWSAAALLILGTLPAGVLLWRRRQAAGQVGGLR
ncbi:hypothetical protein [Mycobacterium sp.]|uniref:hypothetical protein n=1 Tax=Mycobacterium sp. TaxID=1785 RepID=UPI002EF558E8